MHDPLNVKSVLGRHRVLLTNNELRPKYGDSEIPRNICTYLPDFV
jgi:hypothetical protein